MIDYDNTQETKVLKILENVRRIFWGKVLTSRNFTTTDIQSFNFRKIAIIYTVENLQILRNLKYKKSKVLQKFLIM